MPDLQITCGDCGTTFLFAEDEQLFYDQRDLRYPKRCKPCRDARKATGGGDASARQKFEIVCDNCGKQDQVAFKPVAGRPVFCSECYAASRARGRRF